MVYNGGGKLQISARYYYYTLLYYRPGPVLFVLGEARPSHCDNAALDGTLQNIYNRGLLGVHRAMELERGSITLARGSTLLYSFIIESILVEVDRSLVYHAYHVYPSYL